MTRALVGVVSACVLAAVACGGQQGIGEEASSVLAPQVQAVRAAAGRADRQGATDQLARLRQMVGELQASGELSESEAAAVLQAALEVERRLVALPTSPAQPSEEGSVGTSPEDDGDEDDKQNGDDEVRKRAEEAAKKAEEEAKKRAEDARKRAEEANKKRAEEANKD